MSKNPIFCDSLFALKVGKLALRVAGKGEDSLQKVASLLVVLRNLRLNAPKDFRQMA